MVCLECEECGNQTAGVVGREAGVRLMHGFYCEADYEVDVGEDPDDDDDDLPF